MFYVPKINDFLEILTNEEKKDFVAIKFSEYFKSIREEKNLRKTAKSLYIFLTITNEVERYAKMMQWDYSNDCVHHCNIEILNLFDSELQLINTKHMIKNKLKELPSELRKFKVETILVLMYKKKNDGKIFHSNAKIIASDSEIDAAFKFMHQSIMTK